MILLVPSILSDRRETSRNAKLFIKHYMYTAVEQNSVLQGELLFNSLNFSATYLLLIHCHVYGGSVTIMMGYSSDDWIYWYFGYNLS
jgi:hypothetical protein